VLDSDLYILFSLFERFNNMEADTSRQLIQTKPGCQIHAWASAVPCVTCGMTWSWLTQSSIITQRMRSASG